MFLLMGNPLGGAAGGLACCAAVSTAVYAMRKKIPHPTEFGCIGCCFLRGGCHKHEALNVIVEVHEGANIPPGGDVYFYVESGRFDNQTGSVPVDKKTQVAGLFERVRLHIRQMDACIKISLWRHGTISSTLLGDLELDVLNDIINKQFPQLQWYTLKKEGKSTVKVQLSFHKVELDMEKASSPLIEYALIKAARDASLRGEVLNLDFNSLDDKAKLRFLSRVLEGPLKMLAFTWKDVYFKAVEGTRDRWQWKYWANKQEMLDKKKARGAIPLLAISTVLPDTHDRQKFYVKYISKHGTEDLFLNRVDRDRDLWSDGLYEFLERYRQYLQDHSPVSDLELYIKGEVKKEPREMILIDPTKRRLLSPAMKGIQEETTVKHRLPLSVSQMIRDAMEGYEDIEDLAEQEEQEKHEENEKMEEIFDTEPSEGNNLLREGSTGGPA